MKKGGYVIPTKQTYNELQEAYDYFNIRLFNGELPNCLLTLQRKSGRVYGFFAPERFSNAVGNSKTDELAMNPMHFHKRSIEDVLSTLAHEMVHVWQAHYGKPGRRGYHNKEWGRKMMQIGLLPSNTGKPGGKTTGEQMSHYIESNGLFDSVGKGFLARGFRLSWAEGGQEIEPETTTIEVGKKNKPQNKSNRYKYTCIKCRNNAWGKLNLKIFCGVCMQPYYCENLEA